MNDNLDPEKEATTTDEVSEETQSATDANDQQSDNTQSIDWEARYKGLQRASEKKRNELEQQLTKAKSDLESATTLLEEVKSDTGSLESKRSEAERAKEELENEIQTLAKDREALEKQLNQQTIIMSEFPQLAPLAKFIPTAIDEESFRQTASEFNSALTQYIDKGVDASLTGASATFEKGDNEKLVDTSELDKAWDTVYKYGGIPGHEKDVEAANALIMENQPDSDF
jgi:DNA repair exonuclease SbcCD ATPase subunit